MPHRIITETWDDTSTAFTNLGNFLAPLRTPFEQIQQMPDGDDKTRKLEELKGLAGLLENSLYQQLDSILARKSNEYEGLRQAEIRPLYC